MNTNQTINCDRNISSNVDIAAKVTCSAIQNSVSVAALSLTTEVVVENCDIYIKHRGYPNRVCSFGFELNTYLRSI